MLIRFLSQQKTAIACLAPVAYASSPALIALDHFQGVESSHPFNRLPLPLDNSLRVNLGIYA